MEYVRHEFLEAHVLHPGDAFGARKIGLGAITPTWRLRALWTRNLVTSPSALPSLRLNHQPDPALLRHLDADLDAVGEVGAAGTDVGAEYVRAVAFVMHPAGDLVSASPSFRDRRRSRGHAADRRQEDLEVRPGDQIGEHAGGLLEERPAQAALLDAEALRDARQVPHRVDRRLGDLHVAVVEKIYTPSGVSRPAAIASLSSGMLICALVTAIVGRISMPAAIRWAWSSATRWPHGSSETIRSGSAHCGCGPMFHRRRGVREIGAVVALQIPRSDASARYRVGA